MPGPVYRITTAGHEPTPEQLGRERTYLVMMGIRFVAIVLAVILPGWWRLLPVALGVVLPYVAVVLVNAVHTKQPSRPAVSEPPREILTWQPPPNDPRPPA